MTTLESQIQALARQVQEQPDNVAALLAYAEANYMGGHNLEALKVFQRIIQSHPDTAEAHLAIARIYLTQRKFEESYAEVSRMLSQWPTYAGAHLLLRMLLKQADVPLEYIETIRQVNGYIPAPEDAQALRSKVYGERQLITTDIEEFDRVREAVDSDPAVEYHILCAQTRQSFLDQAVAILDAWEKARQEQEQAERARQAAEEAERARRELEAQQEAERERVRQEAEARERDRLRLEEEQRRAEEERRRMEEEAVRAEEERAEAEAAASKPQPSEARLDYYRQHAPALTDVLAALTKTRNVGGALVVAHDGYVVQRDLKEPVGEDEVAQFVRDGLALFEENHPGKFALWVLEFEKGIVVTQNVHTQHVLVLLGGTGANFGALKFAMDKARPQISSILQNVPTV